jgi:hypothetical protein
VRRERAELAQLRASGAQGGGRPDPATMRLALMPPQHAAPAPAAAKPKAGGKRSVEELRAERTAREAAERRREAALMAALARRPTPLPLLDLRENTRYLAPPPLGSAPPNAVRVETSVDAQLERLHLDRGEIVMDTGLVGLPAAHDFVQGALDAWKMEEHLNALDGALADADAS